MESLLFHIFSNSANWMQIQINFCQTATLCLNAEKSPQSWTVFPQKLLVNLFVFCSSCQYFPSSQLKKSGTSSLSFVPFPFTGTWTLALHRAIWPAICCLRWQTYWATHSLALVDSTQALNCTSNGIAKHKWTRPLTWTSSHYGVNYLSASSVFMLDQEGSWLDPLCDNMSLSN